MSDLISRQDALEIIDKMKEIYFDRKVILGKVYDQIKDMPSAEPERKGNWVGIDDEPCETFECDRCGFVLEDWIQGAFYNFCPNCGADMRGEQNE